MTAAAAAPPAGSGQDSRAQPLDDVMLAMDVVDTLRRKERLVQRELDSGEREQALKARLRKIYAAQGLEVSDAILSEAVQALDEDRFAYTPPEPSLAVTLARIYVTRGRWGKWLLGGLAGLALVAAAWQLLVIGPRSELPTQLEAMHAAVTELTEAADAAAQADRLLADGERALRDGQPGAARGALKALAAMRNQLEVAYDIRIINRPGERSGVWRIPAANPDARNYYLIVEAIGPSGQRLSVPITSEETGKTQKVNAWGLRVDKATFDRVAADKQDDGIIQSDQVGQKAAGQLEPSYRLRTSGAAITDW